MYLNVFCLEKKERNVAKAVEDSGHCVAEVSFVGENSLECLEQVLVKRKLV